MHMINTPQSVQRPTQYIVLMVFLYLAVTLLLYNERLINNVKHQSAAWEDPIYG